MYCEQALSISIELGDLRSKAKDLGNLGNPHSRLCEYQTARDYYERALVVARELKDDQVELCNRPHIVRVIFHSIVFCKRAFSESGACGSNDRWGEFLY